MGLLDKDMIPNDTHVYNFMGDSLRIKGIIKLPVTLGEDPASTTQMADFVIIDHPSYYNVVTGRPILRDMSLVTSIYFLSIKFPTQVRIGCVRGCRYDSRDCYNKIIRSGVKKGKLENPRDEEMLDYSQG